MVSYCFRDNFSISLVTPMKTASLGLLEVMAVRGHGQISTYYSASKTNPILVNFAILSSDRDVTLPSSFFLYRLLCRAVHAPNSGSLFLGLQCPFCFWYETSFWNIALSNWLLWSPQTDPHHEIYLLVLTRIPF